MVEFNTVLSFIQAAGIIVGVAYYIMNIRISQRNQALMLKAQEQQVETRQAQLLMEIYSHLREDKFNTHYSRLMHGNDFIDYDDFQAKLNDDLEFRAMINYVCSFFEGVGVLVYRNLIDPQYVDDIMSSYVFQVWEKLGPFIKEAQTRSNRPELWDKFEYLYNETMKIYVQEHGHKFSPKQPK